MLKIKVFIYSLVLLLFNFVPNAAFSVSQEQVRMSVEIAEVLFFSREPDNRISGITNSENKLVILEKTADGQEIYHPASEKISPDPLSVYTLVSEI